MSTAIRTTVTMIRPGHYVARGGAHSRRPTMANNYPTLAELWEAVKFWCLILGAIAIIAFPFLDPFGWLAAWDHHLDQLSTHARWGIAAIIFTVTAIAVAAIRTRGGK